MTTEIEDVLSFWLGELDADGLAASEIQARWWKHDPAFDDLLRERFGALHAEVASGRREAWVQTPRGALAYVIVLDQLSRNLFRGTPGMYAHDARALEVSRAALERGDVSTLRLQERLFHVLPFMHSESLEDQERCVALARELAALHAAFEGNVDFAIQHRDIVARFGRFPHRNAILGRETTPEEAAFLKEPGSSF
ncbi:MAG: DUF924 domain-containing protein [Myxococcales bacterium]|nr:DUF924 domain-containing protein [Myxococcales bacterium]